MKTLKIFEPAMCCPTGMCGVGINPELMRIATVLDNLTQNGVAVGRFNLTSAPQAFVNNPAVNAAINTKGVEALPIIMVDDKIVISGRYPTNEEIITLLEIAPELLQPVKACGCGCGNDKKNNKKSDKKGCC